MSDSESAFELEFPVWSVVKMRQDGQSFSMLRFVHPVHGNCVPIFTDADLAQRYLENTVSGLPGEHRDIPIPTPRNLADVCEQLLREGPRYVVIDFFFGHGYAKAKYFQIEWVIDYCRRKRQ